MVVMAIYMMISLNPKLTLYAVAPLPILVVIFTLTATLLDKRFESLQVKISNFTNIMESCFSGIRVLKAYNREKMWKEKFRQNIAERRAAEISAVRAWAGIDALYGPVWQVGILIVLLLGGYMVIHGQLTYGEIVAFFFYVLALTYSMFDIGQFLVRGRQSAVSIGRLMEIEDYPPLVRNCNHRDTNIDFRELRFDKVSFSYDHQERKILDKVDFSVRKGETVALVGRVGSGKSSVINLLTRVVDPTAGQVAFDDQPLTGMPLDNYRDIIGYVPQEPVLFTDTIEGNIRFGDDRIAREKIDEVVRLAQLESQLERFPQGLQTVIGSRGLTISGGEKQRVAIARALARDPKILILDDCTSALDARTEERLWNALHEVMPEMTCFVVTHRTKTLRIADKILVFDDGKIVDRGKHDELMATSAVYQELYSRSELEEQVGVG